jgi:hypothetical protein
VDCYQVCGVRTIFEVILEGPLILNTPYYTVYH